MKTEILIQVGEIISEVESQISNVLGDENNAHEEFHYCLPQSSVF